MIDVKERKGIKLSRQTIEDLLKSSNLRQIMREINSTAIGSKVRVICKDTLDHRSYIVPGKLTEKKPDGIIVEGRITSLIPYRIIQLYQTN